MDTQKFCKHCDCHHPITLEFWEFDGENPFRCKLARRKRYHEGGGKERAAGYWQNLDAEQRAAKAAHRRELRKLARVGIDKGQKTTNIEKTQEK